jgi:hypothetical protein
VQDFNIRIAKLQSELRHGEIEQTFTQSPRSRRKTVTFDELEAENRRIFEETNRILHRPHTPSPVRPIPSALSPSPTKHTTGYQKRDRLPAKVIEEEEEEGEEKPAPPASKPVVESARPASKPAVESAPAKSTFQAHPISNQNSFNDDFFDAVIRSPVPEPQQPVIPQPKATEAKKPAEKPIPVKKPAPMYSDSGSWNMRDDDLFPDIDLSPPAPAPKGKVAAKAPPKGSATQSKGKLPPVKEHNSAEQFVINEDDIHFDFDGRDPFA